MFGLGMPEILMILAIALIVIGPKKLPDLAKTLGRAMGEFKRSAQDFKASIDIETTVKEVTDLETPATDLKKAVEEAKQEAKTTESEKDDSNDNKADADFSETGEPLTENNPYKNINDSDSDTSQTTTEEKKTE